MLSGKNVRQSQYVCERQGVFTESSDSFFQILAAYFLPGCPPNTFLQSKLASNLPYFLCHWLKLELFLNCNLKKLQKEKQIKFKVRRMEKITTETNKTGNKNNVDNQCNKKLIL